MSKFEREVEIDDSVEKVWAVLTDPNTWPKWFPYVDSVSNVTSFSEGSTFNWESNGQQGTATVVNLEPHKRLEVLTQLGDDKDTHVFTLKSSGGFFGLADDEAKVEYKLDTMTAGGILGRFIAGGNPKDMLRVKNATNALRKAVESLYPKA
ncbi:MAG: SRPBCC family protein [Anaerolineaceae bacterium]|jgi:uncharacterized protein YndB with AHSA1/START domain|nr:SRPBCC family protein [Anaerolineaceae bacterium]HNX46071.1 SRPBCC family protein [Anaerolineaceae bacterium]HPT24160.1 SRPBCC family protein [Anaerolineaceae bacterium]